MDQEFITVSDLTENIVLNYFRVPLADVQKDPSDPRRLLFFYKNKTDAEALLKSLRFRELSVEPQGFLEAEKTVRALIREHRSF